MQAKQAKQAQAQWINNNARYDADSALCSIFRAKSISNFPWLEWLGAFSIRRNNDTDVRHNELAKWLNLTFFFSLFFSHCQQQQLFQALQNGIIMFLWNIPQFFNLHTHFIQIHRRKTLPSTIWITIMHQSINRFDLINILIKIKLEFVSFDSFISHFILQFFAGKWANGLCWFDYVA